MIQFKVGDRVRIKKGTGSRIAMNNMGEITTITRINLEHTHGHTIGPISLDEIYYLEIAIEAGGVWADEIEHCKKECISEVDFLDSFQSNFKDGV